MGKKNRIRYMGVSILLSAYMFMTLYGCNNRKQENGLENPVGDLKGKAQVIRVCRRKDVSKGMDILIGKKVISQPIDYAMLKEAGYEILYRNITKESGNIYEDSWLMEQLAYVFEVDEELRKMGETSDEYFFYPTVIEYFLFDFNGDGKDEYFVLLHGTYWGGRYGTGIRILKKTEDGESEEIYSVSGEFSAGKEGYPLAILDDRVDGYYSFVLPWTDVIWKYNRETGTYSDAYKYRE